MPTPSRSVSSQLQGGSLYLSEGSLPLSRLQGSEGNGSEGKGLSSLAVSVGWAGILFQQVGNIIALTLNSFAWGTEGRDFGWCWNLFIAFQCLIPKGLSSGKDLLNLAGWIPFNFNKLQLPSWPLRKSLTSTSFLTKGTVQDLHPQFLLS